MPLNKETKLYQTVDQDKLNYANERIWYMQKKTNKQKNKI